MPKMKKTREGTTQAFGNKESKKKTPHHPSYPPTNHGQPGSSVQGFHSVPKQKGDEPASIKNRQGKKSTTEKAIQGVIGKKSTGKNDEGHGRKGEPNRFSRRPANLPKI